MKCRSTLLALFALSDVVLAFVPTATTTRHALLSSTLFSTTQDDEAVTTTTTTTAENVLRLTLPKPLGIILEEVVEGSAAGVFVKEVGDAGSAAPHADALVKCPLVSVQGTDVTQYTFEAVMEAILSAPDVVDLEFGVPNAAADEDNVIDYAVGTTVTIVAEQGNGKDDLVFEAKVGDNLRQALLNNGFEVYQGMKQKLGNCGGGGTCTFCAVDILESQGWPARSDYEDKKLAKNPQARLACLNPIQGPVKLRKANR